MAGIRTRKQDIMGPCPRCKGKVMVEQTRSGDEHVCLACGWVGYPTTVPLDEIESEDLYG